MNDHVSCVLELKTSIKNFVRLSICLSACVYVSPSVCMLVYLHNVYGCTITFKGVSESKQNLVGIFYV